MKTIQHYPKTNIIPDVCTEKNPFRGWYHIYTYYADREFPKDEWKWCLTDNETLVLLILNLEAYRLGPMDGATIERLKTAFDFFINAGKDIILRATYDSDGFAKAKEPESISIIKKHMRQLGDVVKTFKSHIYCVQGLFIGNWGEMHGSRYDDEKSLNCLYRCLLKSIPKDIYLSVRTPGQWELLKGSKKRLGFFNDGIMGSETDLGTFMPGRRTRDLMLMSMMSHKRPSGGEMVASKEPPAVEELIERFESMHLSYLNSSYDERALNRLKSTYYDRVNAYDYVSGHLGYSFVAEFGEYDKDTIKLSISNIGFGNIHFDNEVYLIISSDNNEDIRVLTKIDLRDCESKTYRVYRISVKGKLQERLSEKTVFSLYARCLKNGKEIFFTYQR